MTNSLFMVGAGWEREGVDRGVTLVLSLFVDPKASDVILPEYE